MNYTEEEISALEIALPCRQSQIQTLLSLFGQRDHLSCPSLFIYGHTGTGKSYTIATMLRLLQLPHVTINCVEQYTARLQYEHILSNLPLDLADTDGEPASIRCDNMNDFIRHLKQRLLSLNGQTFYLVLDKAERLRDMEVNLLPAFLRLQELTSENLCTILISEIVWEKFYAGTGLCEPFIVHFSDYTKGELIEVLARDCPSSFPQQFYSNYINLVLSVFYMACRDLSELRHLVSLNFTKYVEPIETGEILAEETKKLWKNIEPHLRKALQTVYLREVSSVQWERMLGDREAEDAIQGLSSRTHIELPFYTKYLLIASYLASYNPAKSDKRFFCKRSGKISKREKLVKKHERTTNQLLGPKPFSLDRLLAIFYSIVEGRVAPTANIYMQISSLVTLQFVSHLSDDQLESPKYKCLMSLDFMRSVARTVNFDILRYLYDFI